MPRVALVYPYFRTHSATELLFPPLGVAALAARLHTMGIEARVFDCTFSSLDEIGDSLASYGPDIVGIYCMVTMSRAAFRIAELARARCKGCLTVAGGPLPTLYPQHFMGRLLAPGMRKVLLLGVGLAVFQQWCGINVIFNYAEEIFRAAGYDISDVLKNIAWTSEKYCHDRILTFGLKVN